MDSHCITCGQRDEIDENGHCYDCQDSGITATRLQDMLKATLEYGGDSDMLLELAEALRSVATYADAGLMTRDKGIVLRTKDAEYQLTIVRSR